MKYATILYAVSDNVATITLDRPEVLNALNAQMRVDILHALRRAETDARVLVITGTGRGFCAGQDLSAAKPGARDSERMLREEYNPLILAMANCKIPTISGVNGLAAGVGVSLALATDVVIAAHGASFTLSQSRIGMVPDAGASFGLVRNAGLAKSMGAALFGDTISAQQADDWGLIWESIPDDVFSTQVAKRAAHLANGPTEVYRLIRGVLREGMVQDLSDQVLTEASTQGDANRTHDFLEGVAAFIEKREPKFLGR